MAAAAMGAKSVVMQRVREDFGDFFRDTPKHLIEDGIYHEIATPLKGGVFRIASLTLLATELAKEPPGFVKCVA